jgi:hypothetical protein
MAIDYRKASNTVKNLIQRRGYGGVNIGSTSFVGKQAVEKMFRYGAYGTLGATAATMFVSGTSKKMFNMPEAASRIYHQAPGYAMGRFGFRSSYQSLPTGINGLTFSFRGK